MKQKLKPAVSLLLAFLLVLGLTPTSLFSIEKVYAIETPTGPTEGTCGNGLTWKLTAMPPENWDLANVPPYKLTISGSGQMSNYSYDSAPWSGYAPHISTIEIGNGVTSIGNYAFYQIVGVLNVTLPDSVTSIGDNAFQNCYDLETVVCGSGLTSIGSSAFRETNSLNSIDLSRSGLTSIGSTAFYNSNLKNIALPDSMTFIGASAFRGSFLRTVTFSNVTEIKENAFSSCYNLTTISPLTNVTSIGQSAFENCSQLNSIDLGNRLQTIGERAFYFCQRLNNITIPNSVTSIGNDAFSYCRNLSAITLGSGLTSIGDKAFFDTSINGIALPDSLTSIGSGAFACTRLTEITIPRNVTTIGSGVLYGIVDNNNTDVLTTIRVADGNAKFRIIDHALYEIKNNAPYRAIAYPSATAVTDYAIADGTALVDNYAFYRCPLTALTLPDSVTTLNSYAFAECKNLTSVSFGKNVSSIQFGASGSFKNCANLAVLTTPDADSKLKAVENVLYNADFTTLMFYPFGKTEKEFHVPETVATVGSYAFYYVPKLVELYLPQTLSVLQANAINHNSKLKSIYFAGNEPQANGSIGSYSNSFAINSNANDLLLYRLRDSEEWKNNQYWPTFVFADWNPEDTEVIENQTETFSWKYEAFNDRLTLTGDSLVLSDFAESALTPWYPYIDKIQTVEASVKEVGDFSFYGAKRLLRLSTDSKPSRIGKFAFADCGKLVFLTFSSIADIGEDAFSGDASLRGAWSLQNVTSLGSRAFKGCSSIKEMNFKNSPVTEFPSEALFGCSSLTALTLPDALTTLGENSLQGCSSLKTFIIPPNVATIGSGAMKDMTGMTSVTIPNGVTALSNGVLENCAALTSVTMPARLTFINSNALKGCTALTEIDIPEGVSDIDANAFAGNAALEKVYFKGAFPQNMNESAFAECSKAVLFYLPAKDEGEQWAALGGFWSNLPVKQLDRFYTKQKDHYSFDNSRLSFGYDYDYRIPRQRYVDVLDSIITGTYYYSINKRWGGSCFGMASTTLEFYENINNNSSFDLKNFASSIKNVYDIQAPSRVKDDFSKNLTKLIEAYQISQYLPEISSCRGEIIQHMNDFEGLKERITAFQNSGGLYMDEEATPVVIAVYSPFSGHALVPVSWTQTDNGDFEIEVYDCNTPEEFQTLTINREMTEFSYGAYDLALSYVDYTAIAASMADVTLYSETADNSLYVSIDKEAGTVTDGSGKGIEEIEGAYEQKPFNTVEGDAFSGIRSYVLPDGNYTVAQESSDAPSEETEQQDVTFFMASEDVFAEVTASDETAALSVNTVNDSQNNVSLTLASGENADPDDSVNITLINDAGMEREIDIAGLENQDIQLDINQEKEISITAPETAEVLIDGAEAELDNGQVSLRFTSSERENPFKIHELIADAECNEQNMLNGVVSADLIYSCEEDLSLIHI